MLIENLNDLMHPMVVHVSSTEAAEQVEAGLPEGQKPPPEIPLLTRVDLINCDAPLEIMQAFL